MAECGCGCRIFASARPLFQSRLRLVKSFHNSRNASASCAPSGWKSVSANCAENFSNGGKRIWRRRSEFSSGSGSRHFLPRQPDSSAAFSSPSICASSDRAESGLERGEPVVVPPVKRDGAQGVARQFGQRVMRHGFAAVEEKRDFVAAKNPRERLVVICPDRGRARRNRGNGYAGPRGRISKFRARRRRPRLRDWRRR